MSHKLTVNDESILKDYIKGSLMLFALVSTGALIQYLF